MRTSRSALTHAVLVLAALASSCGGNGDGPKKPIGVLGAFPAELAALVARMDVDESRTIDGRVFRSGRMAGRPVIVAMTGIGLVNARETTKDLLDNFDVGGVVVSGVAAGLTKVGDVAVPRTWLLDDGSSYSCDSAWLERAARVAQAGKITLDSCTLIPEVGPPPGTPAGTRVCFPYTPEVVLGGFGRSSDPYGENPLTCAPGNNDVFACDSEGLNAAAISAGEPGVAELVRVDDETQTCFEQETAAVAKETVARGLPFIAFRSASDGGEDPLDLEGFVEFFAYYRLAAYNAAAATEAFVGALD